MQFDQHDHDRRIAAVEAALAEGHAPPSTKPLGGKQSAMVVAATRLGISASTLRHTFTDGLKSQPDWKIYDRWRQAQIAVTGLGDEIDLQNEIAWRDRAINDLRTRIRDRDREDSEERLASSLRFEPYRIDVEEHDPNSPGFPMTIWSDWHWGETVDKRELGGLNEFNRDVAYERIDRLVSRTIDVFTNYAGPDPTYPGIWVCLGGDMISGGIHEELRETNWGTIEEQAHEVGGALLGALRAMADEFSRVYVPCVVGNHGRRSFKPVAKRRVRENREWGVYKSLEAQLSGDPRFTFFIPDDVDYLFEVYGHRFLLTHGDSLGTKGGDGIIGAVGPIRRGNLKIGSAESQIGRHFDTMIIGHFHSYQPRGALVPVIVNGTFKGFDEYARTLLRVPYDKPVQAAWLVSPRHGIASQVPIEPVVSFTRRPRCAIIHVHQHNGRIVMTDPTPAPVAVDPQSEQVVIYDAIKALVPVLALCGIAVPAALTSQSAEMQIASGVVAVIGIVATGLSYLSHLRKNEVIKTQAAKLALPARATRVSRNAN